MNSKDSAATVAAMMKGKEHVYFARCKDTGHVLIGSTPTLRSHIEELRGQYGVIHYVTYFLTDSPENLIKRFQTEHAENRVFDTDWFNISDKQIRESCDRMQKPNSGWGVK